MADYKLTDENGKPISLSDLTRGNATHVTIVGAGSTVRKNPAHPAEIAGFMEIPKPMHRNRLNALTQDDITPALYNAMVNEYGLFGATQTLSILLTRPVSPSLHHTQKTANLIRARRGESLLPLHRYLPPRKEKRRQDNQDKKNQNKNRNSRGFRKNPTPAEATSAATALGLGATVAQASNRLGRAGGLNLSLDKTTQDIRREVDRMLDDAETRFASGEAGALVSVANRMSMKYENSQEIFNNFAKQVLSPYLITSTANINALKYINEYILPRMREIVGNSDKKRRKLDRQYRYLVDKLATDPKDFYMGTELALIARPGFIFPRAGLVLMPVPEKTSDMAFRAFQQAGTPPTYDPGTGFIATIDKSDKTGVAYINQETFSDINRSTFAQGRNINNVTDVINKLIDVIERYGETDSSGFNVLVRDTRSMAAMGGAQLYEQIAGMPAFYFTDLPGIRPIPTNWPQQLILAMMEILGKNRERITGLDGAFSTTEFLTPSGINLATGSAFGEFASIREWATERARLAALPPADLDEGGDENEAVKKLLRSLSTVARNSGIALAMENPLAPGNFLTPLTDALNPATVAVRDNNRAAMQPLVGIEAALVDWSVPESPVFGAPRQAKPFSAYKSLADFLDNLVAQNRPTGDNGPTAGAAPPKPTVGYSIPYSDLINAPSFTNYMTAIADQLVMIEPITAQKTSNSPSVYEIMVETVELSMSKYNFNPSKDDIYFTTVLLYFCLREMGLDAETGTFLTRISDQLAQARRGQFNTFINRLAARYPVGGGVPLNPVHLANYLALKFAYEAFNDPTSDAFRAMTGVRVNPAPPPLVTDASIKQAKEAMKKYIQSYEKELSGTGAGSSAEMVVNALKDSVVPKLIAQMNLKPEAMITYAGEVKGLKLPASEKLTESINTMFGEAEQAVKEHIIAVGDLAEVCLGSIAVGGAAPKYNAGDIKTALNEVKGSSEKLAILDRTATAADDMVKYLPKSVGKLEKAYINSMKDFMTIIADDIQFTADEVQALTKIVSENEGEINAQNVRPYQIIGVIIDELNELRDVVAAMDATVEAFNKYSIGDIEAATKYSNFEQSDRYELEPGKPKLLSATKRQLVESYHDLFDLLSVTCLTDGEMANMLRKILTPKPDLPIPGLKLSKLNRFDDYIRGKKSTLLIQALHSSGSATPADLNFTATDTVDKAKEYDVMFPGTTSHYDAILEFISEMTTELGAASEEVFKRRVEDQLAFRGERLYRNYQRYTMAGNAVEKVKFGTYKLIDKGKAAGTVGLEAIGGTIGTLATVPAAAGITAAGATIGAADAARGILEGTGRAVGGIAAATGEAVRQTGLTTAESFRTAGALTRQKLREIATDAITATDEVIASMKADARAFKDALKAGVIANAVAANEWKKRRIIGTKAKTAEALARYEQGTTFGPLEAGAVAFASLYMAGNYVNFRKGAQKSVRDGLKAIDSQLKEVNRMLKLLEEFPRDSVGVEGTSLADALTAQLEEILTFSEMQMSKMRRMEMSLPNSVLDDTLDTLEELGRMTAETASKTVELVKTGAAHAKAFGSDMAAGGLAVATLAVEDVLKPAGTALAKGAVGALGATARGGASLVPGVGFAMEAAQQERDRIAAKEAALSSALQKRTLGLPLDPLEQEAFNEYRSGVQ